MEMRSRQSFVSSIPKQVNIHVLKSGIVKTSDILQYLIFHYFGLE